MATAFQTTQGLLVFGGTRSGREGEGILPHPMICSSRGMSLLDGQWQLSARRFIKEALTLTER